LGIPIKEWKVVPFTGSGSTTLITVPATQRLILRSFILSVNGNTEIYLCNEDGVKLSVTFVINGFFVWESKSEYNIDVGYGKNLCINNSSAGVSGEIMLSHDFQYE